MFSEDGEAENGGEAHGEASVPPPTKKTRRDRREEERNKGNIPQRMRGFNEDPFVYLHKEEKDVVFAEIKDYFGIEVLELTLTHFVMTAKPFTYIFVFADPSSGNVL